MTAVLTAADTAPPDDGLPPGQPYVSPDDLSSIPPLFEAAAQQALLPLVAQIFQESAGTVHAQLVDAANLPALPAVSSLAAETYMAQAANTFAQVGDDLWNTARNELLTGFQNGESIPQLSQRLRNSAGLTARKATLVARTQVLDASNAGSYLTAQTSGLDLRKGWLDTPDQRTRPTHRVAGETYGSDAGMIPLADQFMVGGYSCDRPHDPTLPAAEKYSCRCALIYSMGPAAVRTAQEDAAPVAPLPNTSGQPQIPSPPATIPAATVEEIRQIEVENAIRAAYRNTPKPPGGFVGMVPLREATAGRVSREEFDAAMRRLARMPGVRVAPIDNVKALDRADIEAAVHIGASDRHMIAFRGVAEGAADRPIPVLPVEVTPAEAAAAQAAKISEAVASPPVTRQLAHQATITPRAMTQLDSVHIPALGSADGDAYLAAKNGAAHAYYTPLGSHPSVYATAEAATENPAPAIWFNPHWNEARLGPVVKRGIDSGWYTPAPEGLAPLERTLAHEYGHHVTNVLFEAPNFNGTADMAGAVAQRVLGPINDALGANRASAFARNGDLLEPVHWGSVTDPHFSVSGDLLDEWVRQNHDLIAVKVSQYGAKNFDEFLAEVWQEYSTMGAAARPHIQTIGMLLRDVTEELRAGGGTLRIAAEGVQLAEAPLSTRTVIQLRALAKERGIPGYSKLTKPQLVERLSVGVSQPAAVAEAVAELPLAKRRITELRTLAKERGLTVPPRATKADLIQALEAPAAPAVGPGGVAEGAAALEAAPASLVTGRGLTTAQKSALRHYQDQGAHDRINNALRSGQDVSKMARVTQIDQALESSPLRTDVIVERGAHGEDIFGDPSTWPADLTGREWTDAAYISTSAQTTSARGFGGRNQIMLRLHVPAGTRGITMSKFERANGLPDEAELLLERGLSLRVTADRMVFDPTAANPAYQYVRTLDVDVLPRGTVLAPRQLTVAERNAAQRAAAREKNRLIEQKAAAEQTLAELDDLLFKKADREAFEQRIALAQLDPADLAALRGALGDPVKLRAQVTRISKKQGITVSGKAGAKVKFDPAIMDPVGEIPAPGTPMVVIRRGSTITVNGDEVMLNKAVVKFPTAPPVRKAVTAKAAKTAAPKAQAGRTAGHAVPEYRPPATVNAADRAEALRLIQKDPSIRATIQERLGRVSQSGNLTEPETVWLQNLWEREPAFVERLAQTSRIEEDLARAADAAGSTQAQFQARVAARLKTVFDNPVGVRVSGEDTLRQILTNGRFKTQFEGAKRASGLRATVEKRRLAEQVQGVARDIPVAERPVYGYVMPNGIRPAGVGGSRGDDLLSTYGQIQVVLKPEIRARTTATIGDSLDSIYSVQPSPIDNPTALSANPSYRWSIGDIDKVFTDDFRRSSYVEAQIHGGIRVGDIAEVVFPSQPDAATVAALNKAGIPWRVLAE